MKNTIDKKGQKQGIWQTQNKAKTILIEENYKNGILHGKRTVTYKGDWFREQFYMNEQLFGENLRNDKPLIRKFHEIIDGGKWKIDKEKFPRCGGEIFQNSKFWFVSGKCMLGYSHQNNILRNKILWVRSGGFWRVFESEFDMSRQEIEEFIKHQVEEYFKLKVDTTPIAEDHGPAVVEKYFKSKVDPTFANEKTLQVEGLITKNEGTAYGMSSNGEILQIRKMQ